MPDKERDQERDNFDEGWKEIIEFYFPELMEFFFPDMYQDIDFAGGYEFLDTDLERIVKDSVAGKRQADKLVKVILRDGQLRCILIHVDVQGYYDLEFARRMYTYNYRIFDRYGIEVVSAAILADEHKNFRPSRYEVKQWGFRCLFEFPVVKLLDYLDIWDELENTANPFGVVVMAHLKSMKTRKGSDDRLLWKIRLVKMLYDRGYTKEDILNLYRFIDWVITLPYDMKSRFNDEIIKYEKEKKMPYITTAESIGLEKGREEGLRKGREEGLQKGVLLGLCEAIDLGLRLKFGVEGLQLMVEINNITDVKKLRLIKETIEIAHDLQDIRKIVQS
jgi:hypothetical protein